MTTATTPRLTTQLSPVVRAAAAVAAIAFVTGAWMEAGQSSHHAVQQAQVTLGRTYVTLPRVDIVGRRDEAGLRTAALPARRTAY